MKPFELYCESHLGTIVFETPAFSRMFQIMKSVLPFVKCERYAMCHVMVHNNHVFLQTPSGYISPIHPPVLHTLDDQFTQNRFIMTLVRALHHLETHHKSNVAMEDLLGNATRKPIEVWNIHHNIQEMFIQKKQIQKWIGNMNFRQTGSLISELEVETLFCRSYEYTPIPKHKGPTGFTPFSTSKTIKYTYV